MVPKFNLGDKVKLKETCEYHYQAPGLEGIIQPYRSDKKTHYKIGYGGTIWYSILWSSNYEDNYPENGLILISPKLEINLNRKVLNIMKGIKN